MMAAAFKGLVKKSKVRLFCLTLILTPAFTGVARAQVYLSNLTGDVTDSSGAKISGATVTATDTTTHFVTKSVTNANGVYSFPFLAPDTYIVTVEANGFRTESHTGVLLTAGQTVANNFSLTVGRVQETVTVTDQTPLLNTESAELGDTFTAKQVTDMPNLGRVPFMVAALAPGAWDNGYMNTKTDTTLTPWGGGATATAGNGVGGHTRVTIDGTPDDPLERSGGTGSGDYTGFTPSPESIQEVKIQTALYDAEYGHGGGTVINTVLRSGNNDYHGAAYFVFRNTYMDANTYERVPNQNGAVNPKSATPRTNETWNQPGAVISGPLRIPHVYDGRDKTFFMVAYERVGLRGTQISGATDFVPTAAELNGDFSALCPGGFSNGVCVPGGGVQIYDPLTLDSHNNRTPFPNNQIPSNRINPAGLALLKYFPAPNANYSSTVNYISPRDVDPEKYFSVTSRVDEAISEKHKLSFVFYNQVLGQEITNQGFPTPIGPTGDGDTVFRNNHGGSIDYVGQLPRAWVLDARVGVIYHPFGVVYPGDPFNLSSISMSSAGLSYQTFPGLSFSDSYSGLQAASGSQLSDDTLMTAAAIASKVVGHHNLRFGTQWEVHRYAASNPLSGLGTFNFDRRFTQKNSVNTAVGADTSSGNPIASLLLGYASSGSYANQVSFEIQQPYQAYFIQDEWRARTDLTFNMGLRWEDEAPYTERYNRLSTGFCTTCTNPLQSSVAGLTLKGGLTFASPSNRGYYQSELTDWQPRFGFSYKLPGTTRTVLHGGIGLIYFNSQEGPIGNGFSASTNYVATTDNTHPATSITNPFPNGTNQPTGSSLGLSTLLGQSLNFIEPQFRRPRNLQWSVSEQTLLPLNLTLQLAYEGNRSYYMENSRNINALPAQYYNQGAAGITYLQTQVPNPMAGLIPTNSTLNGATIQRQYLLLPYPEFSTLTETPLTTGGSLYNSLQVLLTKPMGHRVSITASFTWNHQMDSLSYLNATDAAPYRYQDGAPTLLGNLYVNYKLPDFSNMPYTARLVLGGWQANAVMRAYNGTLVSNPGGVTWLSNPNIGGHNYQRYFNTCYENSSGQLMITGVNTSAPACRSANDSPAFRQNLSFTLNSTSPSMTGVRVLDHPDVDASLFKVFPIHESLTFEIRGEFFNVLNTPNFGGPGTSPGATNYGIVTLTQQNDPRIGQLTARVNF